MDVALDQIRRNGGLDRPRDMISSEWNRARLSYEVAMRRWEQVREKGQLQSEREQEWDNAHSGEYTGDDAIEIVASDVACPVCASMADQSNIAYHAPEVNRLAWWECPGDLVPDAAPKIPSRPKRVNRQMQFHGSPTMRVVIREHRTAHAAERAEKELIERRYKTESAIRRKHNLAEEEHFDADFWDSPISGLITRQSHNSMKEYQRMAERRARGNTPRPRPPRSSLSYCESAGEVEFQGGAAEKLRAAEEEQERERWERKARQVGAEVGYLYFSGTVDGLADWREDFLRSDHSLIWRDREQRGDAMDLDMDIDDAEWED